MTPITLPMWQIIGAVGAPCLLVFILMLRLRRGRNRQQHYEHAAVSPPLVQSDRFTGQIHQEMLSQQIDAVFKALTQVIEAERVKLKALLLPMRAAAADSAVFDACPVQPQQQAGASVSFQAAKGHPYSRPDGDDVPAVKSAGETGLSRNEAALALKLRQAGLEKTADLEVVA